MYTSTTGTGTDTDSASALTWAAAVVCSQLYMLASSGRIEVARCLLNGLADELRAEVLRVMDADLPRRVIAAIDAGLLDPATVHVDTTTTPPRIVVRELTEPEGPRRPQEPMWDQLVESALVTVFGDRELVDAITDNHDSYRDLVRRVRERTEEDHVEVVEVLRRLGEATLATAAEVPDPVAYLTTTVRDWTPETDTAW